MPPWGKTSPTFKAGDTVRVGFKVTEGSRTRVQNYEGVCIARNRWQLASPVRSPSAKSRSAKAWSVYSRCIRPTSTASPLFAVAASVAPNCTTCVPVVVNPHVSQRSPTTSPKLAPKRKERKDEKRHPSRLSRHRRQNDRWHRCSDEIHLGQPKAISWLWKSTPPCTPHGPVARRA